MLLLFSLVTGGYMLYRHSDFYVWNDTPGLLYNDRPELETWEVADNSRAFARAEWQLRPIHRLILQAHGTFGWLTANGYRPLDGMQANLSLRASRPGGPGTTQLLIFGSMYGAFAVCFFLLARRFTTFDATALLAVVLIFGAPPLVSASWLVVASSQVIVPLIICSTLLLYWQIVESPRGRWLKLLALGFLLLVGPWFREFCGISCLLITFLELRRTRRVTPLMGMAGVFLLHALYPTAIVKWLAFPDLPLLPVTKMGSLGSSVLEKGFHWDMAWAFLPLLPPLLMLLATGNSLRLAGQQIFHRRPICWADWKARGVQYLLMGVVPCVWFAAVLFLSLNTRHDSRNLLGFALCLYIAVVGLQFDLFLVVWFLLSFVPLMRVVVETVHFLYALVPGCIILACAMESLWQWAASRPSRAGLLRYALALALGVVVADQLLVIYGTHRVMHQQYEGIHAIATDLKHRIPQGSYVICNAIHGVEIKWASDGHYLNLWSMPWGVNRPDCVVDDKYKLERLLAQAYPRSKIYLLDCDFERSPAKLGHQHAFVHRFEVDKRSLGTIHVLAATYPFADPLRHFISRENVPFLGPPDLVNDYYRGPALDGSWFSNEVHADYCLYEVTGKRVISKEAPSLALSDVQGFNIIAQDGWYFGVPQTAGAFDAKKAWQNGYPICYLANSLEEVKLMIESAAECLADDQSDTSPLAHDMLPRLELAGLHGFNIISCGGDFFGVPQTSGTFDLEKVQKHQYAVIFQGTDIEEVKRKIKASQATGVARRPVGPSSATSTQLNGDRK
jgi:hypothetical protein